MGSVSRLALVELIEEQKAKLSPKALELWEDVDASLYLSPEEETRLKPHERAPFERIGRLPEADQRAINVLTELRAGLYQSDFLDDRGKPSQGERDRCVIRASIFKDRDERGPGMPLSLEERLGRTVDQAIAGSGRAASFCSTASRGPLGGPESAFEEPGGRSPGPS